MIRYLKGNLLESNAEALVNTVNTVGVMGKGIALQFKTQFPKNYKEYAKVCKASELNIGQLLVVEDTSLLYGPKLIINFPTKTTWKKPSEYYYVAQGLVALRNEIIDRKIASVALPPLGAGNGGLVWTEVRKMIEQHLQDLDCDIQVYEPNAEMLEVLKKERVALTPARAMLLAVLYEVVRHGESASEFASEKVCYFLQRFGAADMLKLQYKANFYGPYSDKVRHVLFYLNGSYLRGYGDKSKKPFEELDLLMDAEPEVTQYLAERPLELEVVNRTKAFLEGYYDTFALELLSTLDFIVQEEQTLDKERILTRLEQWSDRKSKLFANDRYLDLGLSHIASINQF